MSNPRWQLIISVVGHEDPTLQFLRALFRRAAAPVVSGLLLSACGADERSVSTRGAALEDRSLNCTDIARWRPMSALKLTHNLDHVSLRRHQWAPHPAIQVVDAAGRPCATSQSPRLCEAEMRRVSLLETKPEGSHLLTSMGDTVRALQTLEDKLELLGAIDTPDEALLLLEHANIPVGCNQDQFGEATQVHVADDGYRIVTRTPDHCGNARTQYTVQVSTQGVLNILDETALPASGCVVGRRPPNLVAVRGRPRRGSALGCYFARAARLEAASVDAFEQIAEELRVFGAPHALREAARAAAEDEVRHARTTAALAERLGARPQQPRLLRRRLRDRAELALDNAIEGCVHETYSAYVATVQAQLVTEQPLSGALSGIADDETRHAALAWQLASWLEPQLAPSTRQHIDGARRRALGGLGARG